MIRPYLRDLINYRKPTTELNNNTNNNANNNADNNANNNANNSNTERGEWKVQQIMQNNYISVKNFEDTRTIYSASKQVEVFMGSNTDDAIDTHLLIRFYKDFNKQ